MSFNILAADIGGTNSRFARFSAKSREDMQLLSSQWLPTADYSSFSELLLALPKTNLGLDLPQADVAVFAVAGAVEQGSYANPPLIPWDIDLSQLTSQFKIRSPILINDFLAQAWACGSPIVEEAEEILPGEVEPGATTAVIGAGTGLGKAFLLQDRQGRHFAAPSEGGHGNFCPQSQREFDFCEFARAKASSEYLSWNDVVSGRGLALIHEFLTGEQLAPAEVAGQFTAGAAETLEWAASFYGRVCRNFALDALAQGGLYIAGGVAAKNPRLIEHSLFAEEFYSSPRQRALLQKIPVFLISDQQSGLWGAAYCGLQNLTL